MSGMSREATRKTFWQAAGTLLGELRTDGELIYQEVHYLAYHYHWSEHEIMEMTRDKRRKYIDVLADAIEVLNSDT